MLCILGALIELVFTMRINAKAPPINDMATVVI